MQTHVSLTMARESITDGVEIGIWAAHPQQAPIDALPLLRAAVHTAEAQVCGDLFVLAARACADLMAHSRAVDDPGEAATAMQAAAHLEELLAQCIDDPFDVSTARASAAADALSWAAELGRLQGPNHPDGWAEAATAWESLGAPHRAAYALLRQAEALLTTSHSRREAQRVLRRAAALAAEHAMLQSAVAELAARARITLPADPQEPDRAERATTAFGLTAREIDVLRLVGAGHTNADIGAVLFISARTVGVHVGHILAKLHVSSRVQAAATAHELHLVEPST